MRQALIKAHPNLGQFDQLLAQSLSAIKPRKSFKFQAQKIDPVFDNYYMTDVISRHSQTMAECREVLGGNTVTDSKEVA